LFRQNSPVLEPLDCFSSYLYENTMSHDLFHLIPRSLFKYVTADTALKVLTNKTLRWSSPDSFNDPFEFRSPFEFGFELEQLEEPFLQQASILITQQDNPDLFQDNPVADVIRKARAQRLGGGDPVKIRELFRPRFPEYVNRLKQGLESDRNVWLEMKKTYRVLCLSAVRDNILMWSHYADEHKGAVLEFQPKIELGTEMLGARIVTYSKEVPVAVTLEQFLLYITGQGPKPRPQDPFVKSVYTKSSDWIYENEWRILTEQRKEEQGPISYRPFHPQELAAIYFGCRMSDSDKESIRSAVSSLGSHVSFFQMRVERIRYELTAEPLG
jgi:hypothetical protein